MFELINITRETKEKTILKDINLKLPKTGFIVIKGENGSGKSTLLNIIGTLDRPTSGEILFNNANLVNLSENDLLKYREKYLSFIFQDYNLFENSSVLDNINIIGINNRIDKIVELLKIKPLLNKKVKKLSGGEKQRVAIARCLAKDSKVILADEPTSSLDYETKDLLFKVLKEESQNKLVIMVSHDMDLINKYADKIIEMNNGIITNISDLNISTRENEIKPYNNVFHFFKFTINNMFKNKKRLILSSILLIFSFLLLLLSTSLSTLDFIKIHSDTMTLENDDLILFNAYIQNDNSRIQKIEYNEEDIAYLNQNKISTNPLEIGKGIKENNKNLMLEIKYNSNINKPYYRYFINKYSFFDIENLNKVDYGRKPNSDDEIVISSYLADLIIEFGIKDINDQYYMPKDYNSLINDNHLIKFGSNSLKIVGIYELNLAEYSDLKKEYDLIKVKNSNMTEFSLNKDLEKKLLIFDTKVNHLAGNIYVKDDFFKKYEEAIPTIPNNYSFALGEKYNNNMLLKNIPTIVSNSSEIILNDDKIITNLEKNEIIVNEEILNMLNLTIENCLGHNFKIWIGEVYDEETEIISNIETLDLTIKGVSKDQNYYLNKDTLKNVLDSKISVNKLMLRENNKNTLTQLFKKFPIMDNDYTIETNYSHSIEGLMGFSTIISKVFRIISVFFLIFSFIVLTNYISNSIDIHLKDIAILKSLGINQPKIKNIFQSEALILLLISYFISLLCFLILRIIFNKIALNIMLFKINVFPISIFYIAITYIIILLFIIINFIIIQNKLKKTMPIDVYKVN